MSKPNNRLPEPPTPEVFATVHLYHACIRLCDALAEPDMRACQEWGDYRAMIFAVRMIATNLESSHKVHPLVRKAEDKFIRRLIALDGADEVMFPRSVFERVTPSAN